MKKVKVAIIISIAASGFASGFGHGQESDRAQSATVAFDPLIVPDRSDYVFARTDGPSGTIGAIMPPALVSMHKQRVSELAQYGYYTNVESLSRIDYVRERMEERLRFSDEHNLSHSLEDVGFEQVEVAQARGFKGLAFSPSLVPNQYRNVGSEGYVFAGGPRVKQLYTDTSFGTILIDEGRNSTIELGGSNAVVDGNAAALYGIRYRDDQWATVLLVHDGNRVLMLESDLLLDREKRSRFSELAGTLLRSEQ